jgi:hypothetical protein
MPATGESQARTRAFARIIEPWLIIVPGVIALRASEMGALASEFRVVRGRAASVHRGSPRSS